ncbi:hypothetical protein EHI8A_024110 [Entamoeba histolytica HM-1:IMSS-B]|uniref:Uncharacterized protein n=6 Tax=Entamoeba histolytica TaxID=5759 RepID=C4LWW7_ENTH1|nr:hypothetical protein EHI_126910 [Entamoeba histolytica HM-1:IMSS]EMD48647.1 Hypothetical protein EHI5A_012210 [Entamoeba histolytica KU27]EMH75356.1 hypothetical protein EHI8A_024110 [Entamoeba histolytica HM-1:IMSS-B]EMS13929.1 hypothetical protein KM1_012570 [Entamoeba histolytica HM-3:IMSS]ENY64649.1 hypothetical protein EHI7A_003200 [Entamoeba histolytica HM-1:IMSS-A]GAT93212.1 hypothetical protein CL6EHI_126910 [Entamoeba histolytica]|eukprot:XP_651542.1 hypothetical protein EHI_126910 [Entamoeba histolytica HM-1:IMSS]
MDSIQIQSSKNDFSISQDEKSTNCQKSHGSERKKFKKDEAKYTLKKREMKNLESYQQAALLCLMNSKCSFSVEHPGKQSKVTVTMPRLVNLYIDKQEIEVAKLADTQSQLIMKKEVAGGVSQTTSTRRYEKNKRIFTQNFLFDLCLEYGFWFESKPSRKSKKSHQMERITRIYYKDTYLMNQTKMMELGKAVNSFLFSNIINDKRVTINQNNSKLSDIKKSFGLNDILFM